MVRKNLIDIVDFTIGLYRQADDSYNLTILVLPSDIFDAFCVVACLAWRTIGNTRQVVYKGTVLERESVAHTNYVTERFYRKVKFNEDF